MSDRVLTIGERSRLASLVKGTADAYQEVLRPGELIVVNAHGTLDDTVLPTARPCPHQHQAPVVRIQIG
ncbi:MAG TPA: hypothetical protein VHG90_11225 [Acidimicrobiales bacterium]|nr:hypothetical protein [Acidimicrobiales bacterium]